MRMQLMNQNNQQGMMQQQQGYGGHQMGPPSTNPQMQMMPQGVNIVRPPGGGPANTNNQNHRLAPMHHLQHQQQPHHPIQQQMPPHPHPSFNQQHMFTNQSGGPVPPHPSIPPHPHQNTHLQQHHHHLHHTQHHHHQPNLPIHMQPEFRIYEMNKRLASKPDQDFNEGMWWDSFVHEFFEDDAKLSIRNLIDENVSKNFTISRTLIPRFFRSIYEGGVTELHFNLSRGGSTQVLTSNVKVEPNSPPHNLVIFESDLCTMTTKYGKPMYAIIFTEGHFSIEFGSEEMVNNQALPSIRIRNWVFSIRRHQELVPRSTIAIQQDQAGIEQLSKNITKAGLANHTLNYLKLCSILEPMQEIMIRSKMTSASPRECLKQNVSQKTMHQMNLGQVASGDKMPLNTPITPTTPTATTASTTAATPQTGPTSVVEKPTPATPNKRKKKRKLSSSSSTTTTEVTQAPTPTKTNSRSKKATAEAKAAAALAAKQQQQLQQQQQQMYMSLSMGGDVMIVGEPGLMGGDFGEEDERLITRLENNQIEAPNFNHGLHHQQQPQQHMQYHHQQPQQNHFNNISNITNSLSSRSSPVQLINPDMHSHPTRPHSLQSHLSQPNVTQSSMSLPPRPQSTSSHLLNSSSLHGSPQPSNTTGPIQAALQSPSSNQLDNSNKIISSLPNDTNEIADGSGTVVFNPTTSASNLASSSDGLDFNDLNTGSTTAATTSTPAINQPSTSSSSIASSSATSPNNSSPSNNNTPTTTNTMNSNNNTNTNTNINSNNNSSNNNISNKPDVQQSQSISLSNYS